MPNPNYVSPKRLYLTADGKVVERDDPRRQELLVPEGGELPMERAEELGLVKRKPANKKASADTAEAEA